MGNPDMDERMSAPQASAVITQFYSPDAWIEGRAEDQLHHVSSWAGVSHIAAFPDLHPGKYGPVGCAILADRIYPQLIGNDIGCGMSLFQLDLPIRKFKLEKAVRRIRALGEPMDTPQCSRLDEIGLPAHLFPNALGTISGGNHFCEVQTLIDPQDGCDLDHALTYLLVHSGSRGLGEATLNALPQGAFGGLLANETDAMAYVASHNQAVVGPNSTGRSLQNARRMHCVPTFVSSQMSRTTFSPQRRLVGSIVKGPQLPLIWFLWQGPAPRPVIWFAPSVMNPLCLHSPMGLAAAMTGRQCMVGCAANGLI